MNKLSTYLSSLIVSVLLVLGIIGVSGALIADINITRENATKLVENENITAKVHTELNSYYTDKYGSSGIPASVYMNNIDDNYLEQCINICISSTFDSLEKGSVPDMPMPKNDALEKSITDFFTDYADKAGYEMDENFNNKLSTTVSNAYQTIRSHSDVYKASSLNEHKVLGILSKLYSKRNVLTAAAAVFTALLILVLVLINRKNKVTAMYWTGISSIIAGVFVTVPCCILLSTRYYDSFSIKQPAVFAAYTSAMYKLTNAFTAVGIALVLAGILLCVVYTITYDKDKHQDVKPTQV